MRDHYKSLVNGYFGGRERMEIVTGHMEEPLCWVAKFSLLVWVIVTGILAS